MFYILVLILTARTILAQRPDWYPENPAKIEEQCMREHSITPEIWSTIRSFHLDDTPNVGSFFLCLNTKKGVFRPEKGFEPERLAIGIRMTTKVDCDVNMIRNCGDRYKELKPHDHMILNIIKCIFENKEGNCRKIQ
uniref:Uncharacterized protein n=1 Tax=Stomoxys calcitrans TaxID=35570 RepID=A0A1I8NMK7_STOCA